MRRFLLTHFLLLGMVLCSCLSDTETPIEQPSDVGEFFGCPPEDIAEYPELAEPPVGWNEPPYWAGICWVDLVLSKSEISFNARGGVRCLTADRSLVVGRGRNCEDCVLGDKVGWNDYAKMECPWLVAAGVGERALRISVERNETGEDRELIIEVGGSDCWSSVKVTQSKD